MKRDLDYMRELLLSIEGGKYDFREAGSMNRLRDELKLSYHLRLLKEAGYIAVQTESSSGAMVLKGLTSEGHDYLDAIRDPETWAKTKKGALAAGGFTLDLLKDLAKGLIKKEIEKRTDVKL